jgi:hypothetical protein
MRSVTTAIVLLAASVASLPPQWCGDLSFSVYACCDDCCEQSEGQAPENDAECKCCALVLKEPDAGPAMPAAAPEIAGSLTVVESLLNLPETPAISAHKRQELLFCWRF